MQYNVYVCVCMCGCQLQHLITDFVVTESRFNVEY